MNFLLFSKGKERETSVDFLKTAFLEPGIFESLRTYRGKIFRLEEHLKRFMESAKTLGLEGQISLETVRQELLGALEALSRKKNLPPDEDYFFRITWWHSGIYVLAGQRKHPRGLYHRGAALRTSCVKRSPAHALPAGAKTTDYVNALLATLEPKPDEIYEWVFLDPQGFVTEVRIGNLFMVKDGILWTPPALYLLNGVTRRFVIECAQDLKIPVREVPLTRHDLYNAQEAFLTNTSWEILPVRELDGRKIGGDIPGAVTRQLQQTFKQKVQSSCR